MFIYSGIGLLGLWLMASGTLLAGESNKVNACAAADALRKAGYLDEAKAAYVELLTGAAKPVCASEGLIQAHQAAVAKGEELCASADALLTTGYVDDAKTVYLELLKGDAQPACARSGLAKVKTEEDAERDAFISRVRALANFGLHDKALETLKTRLETDEELVIPPDLQYLSGGKVPGWRSLRRDLEPWAIPILEILAGVIVVVVLVYLLTRRIAKYSLSIADFDSDGLDEQHLGKDFPYILRSQLNRMAAGSRRACLSMVTGPVQDIQIPAEIEAVIPSGSKSWLSPATWVKAIPALFNWLVPPRSVTINGYLHKPNSRGVGLTLQLTEGSRILSSYTFWQTHFDDASDPTSDETVDCFYQLAEYAAVWLLFETANKFAKSLELLGTRNWHSYAYFRAGVYAADQKRETAAKKLYIRALQLDPKLRGARVNLARGFMQQEPQLALEQLERVKNECDKSRYGDQDPTSYSAIYNLAVLKYEANKDKEAKKEIEDLLGRIDSTLIKIDTLQRSFPARLKARIKVYLQEKIETRKSQRFAKLNTKLQAFLRSGGPVGLSYLDPTLQHHLVTIRHGVASAKGVLQVELGEEGGLECIEQETNVSSVFPLHQYNLACGYAVLADKLPPPTHGSDAPKQRRKTYLESSLNHLARAFQMDATLVEVAKEDRSLDFLRKEKPDEYDALIAKFESPAAVASAAETELPLSKVIGEEHAKNLHVVENITLPDELLAKTLEPAARNALATKLNVTVRVVTKWAHEMDLLRITGLQSTHLGLLAKAGIHRLADLAASNAASLQPFLVDLSKELGIEAPDDKTVGAWVSDAQTNTLPKVI